MKTFEVIDCTINNTDINDGYKECKIVGGGYDSNIGFYAEVMMLPENRILEFKILDTETYYEILQAYLNKESIGLIL